MKLATKIFKRNDWYVTSPFGYRKPIKTSNGTSGTFHDGCDYGTNGQKWPQYAIEDGIVLNCGNDKTGAKYVWINYPRINKKLLHYHLDNICVIKNQSVTENTILGYTGKTGMSTGIHLHLGMKDSNGTQYQDPHEYEYEEANDKSANHIPENNQITYTIKKGDTLIKIAKKYNTTWKKIYQKNIDIIGGNPNLIIPGQILKI